MTHFQLNPKTRTQDIYVNGVLVEQLPITMPLAERDARLAAHGYQQQAVLSRRRQEQLARSRGGWGTSRSGRRT